LQGWHALFCAFGAFCRMRRVFPPNRVLLAGQRSRLTQAAPAPQLRSSGDAGIPLFVRQ
jgi:hypothetical protein